MRYVFLFLISSIALAQESRQKVLVVDTGIDVTDKSFDGYLCKDLAYDATGFGINDTNGHGTNIASIIKSKVDKSKQCLVIAKWYDDKIAGQQRTLLNNVKKVLTYAKSIKPTFINLSMYGEDSSDDEETLLKFLSLTSKIVVSSGNDGSLLRKNCGVFPACYDIANNFYVVGSMCNHKLEKYSNYSLDSDGPVRYYTCGMYRTNGKIWYGTSQAAAIMTGELINEENNR